MIHPTAIIDPSAQLAQGVEVGPYAIIGPHVSIGAGSRVGAHAMIDSWTEIGKENHIYQFASVGAPPQDLKYGGEETHLKIGDRNRIREFATLHRGTVEGGGVTTVGSDCLFMAYSHVAHDCIVHDHVILANGATLAGHVEVEQHAIIGGLAAVHQFCRLGCHTMISGGAMVAQDIPPFTVAQGDRAKTVGLNLIGLKRRGFSDDSVRGLKQAYRLIFRSGLRLDEALQSIAEDIDSSPELEHFVAFIKKSQRGIAR
ncbi:MAG: acyl-ACP--UDP-N-acetylglucosamine O-acyltransferase [Deltaproteobacteria bacterium]|jgi:UDP-N-acetylglucosamine acyltransferase|nr:acyl-ACP--UDP-N-acetylglucosamine O-acyltransferase [Deltaproteobacteria bacterium]MBW2504224.1 acyl-ACP--UDP-N-acetylglucosamine O-acyltransferase [Deltaproteobacteria bacterium]